MNVGNITVHIETEYACGHMHDTIFHVKEPKLEGHLSTKFPGICVGRDKKFTPHVETEIENKLELTGSLGRIEFAACMCHLSRIDRMRRWLLRVMPKYRRKGPAWLDELMNATKKGEVPW